MEHFFGGAGTDTIRFVKALNNFLFIDTGSHYTLFNLVTRISFDIAIDVEIFEFANGLQQYNLPGLASGTQIRTIESTGTILQHAAQGSYLLGGSSANIPVTLNGVIMGENSIAGWEAVQVQAQISGGYKLLWKNTDGVYSEWTLDGAGAHLSISNVTNVVDVEVFYGADLNNDGTIGHTTTTIESDGSATLTSSTHGIYLIDGSIEITQNGVALGPNSFAGWSAIQAEAVGGGYRVLWQHTDGSLADWTLDSQGNLVSASNPASVIDVEVDYGLDLNNDGATGHITTTIENDGSTTLASSTRGIYLIDGSTEITQNGVALGPNSFAGWSAIQAEAVSGGYRVLWQHTGGTYADWTLDSQGNLVAASNLTNIIDVEMDYGLDLNNDGTTGHFNTTIENDGSTTLASSTRGMYLIDDSVEIKLSGTALGPDSFVGWAAIQAEASGGGYRVLWEHTSGAYADWTLDNQGNLVAANNLTNIIDVELDYGLDLNNDGTIGHFNTTIENNGSTTLASSTRGTYLIDDSIEIKLSGAAMGPDSFEGWAAIQAEVSGGGYRVLWEHTSGTYADWTLDSQGNLLSTSNFNDPVGVEQFYGADIDNSGFIGPVPPKTAPFAKQLQELASEQNTKKAPVDLSDMDGSGGFVFKDLENGEISGDFEDDLAGLRDVVEGAEGVWSASNQDDLEEDAGVIFLFELETSEDTFLI